MKIEHHFVIKMKTMMSSLLIFIRSIENHTIRKGPVKILIPKLCRTKITILMMILKITIRKTRIVIHRKK